MEAMSSGAGAPHSYLSRTKLEEEGEPALARTFGAWQAQKWAASRDTGGNSGDYGI